MDGYTGDNGLTRREFSGVVMPALAGLALSLFSPEPLLGAGRDYKNIPVPRVGYRPINPEPNYNGIQLADEERGVTGRLERVLRWEPITDAVERRYGVPKNLLIAMIMQESYGNPIQPNMRMDGGLGLMHMQPVVADMYGLKVYGDRHVLASRKYGKGLEQMLRSCKWDMRCIAPKDDRIQPVKNIDCGARIVKTGQQKHGRWDHAAEYYYAPGFVGKRLGWRYWSNVNRFLSASRSPESRRNARDDFNRRNDGFTVTYPNGTRRKASWERYIDDFTGICENYGLGDYKKLGKVS